MCPDRVHLCRPIPPKYQVSKIVGYIKGVSTMKLFGQHSEWRKTTGRDRTFWVRGYYVSTVGMNEATIKKYIKEQEDSSKIG
jgi:putative transposase